MPIVPIAPPSVERTVPPSSLPSLLETPLGLAILELQGSINFPQPDSGNTQSSINVGKLVFPDYDPSAGSIEGAWQKRVWFYVGHQRMTGEVKRLPKPLGVLRRRPKQQNSTETPIGGAQTDNNDDTLEIMEIIRWKLVFNSRPEPVGVNGV